MDTSDAQNNVNDNSNYNDFDFDEDLDTSITKMSLKKKQAPGKLILSYHFKNTFLYITNLISHPLFYLSAEKS